MSKSKLFGYIAVDSGAIAIGDPSIVQMPNELGPINELDHIKLDAVVAQGFLIPTMFGDGIYAVIGHYGSDNESLEAITIELAND